MCYFWTMAKKRVVKQRVLRYTAVFEPQVEGGFTVIVPSLPGCVSQGDTFEEASVNIKEAVELYLEDASAEEIDNTTAFPFVVSPIEVFVKCR